MPPKWEICVCRSLYLLQNDQNLNKYGGAFEQHSQNPRWPPAAILDFFQDF